MKNGEIRLSREHMRPPKRKVKTWVIVVVILVVIVVSAIGLYLLYNEINGSPKFVIEDKEVNYRNNQWECVYIIANTGGKAGNVTVMCMFTDTAGSVTWYGSFHIDAGSYWVETTTFTTSGDPNGPYNFSIQIVS
jgi:hypothetical protein